MISEFSEIVNSIGEFKGSLEPPINQEMKILSSQILEMLSEFSMFFETVKKVFTKDYQDHVILNFQEVTTISSAKEIGLDFIKNKNIEKPIESGSLVFSLILDYWNKLSQQIVNSTKFKPVLLEIKKFYFKNLDLKIEEELEKVPINIDSVVKKEYKKAYYRKPLTFEDYLNINKEIEENSLQSESIKSSGNLRKRFEIAIEEKKLEKMKDEQVKTFDNYEKYFNMDSRELERIKRKGKIKRKHNKKTRRGK